MAGRFIRECNICGKELVRLRRHILTVHPETENIELAIRQSPKKRFRIERLPHRLLNKLSNKFTIEETDRQVLADFVEKLLRGKVGTTPRQFRRLHKIRKYLRNFDDQNFTKLWRLIQILVE